MKVTSDRIKARAEQLRSGGFKLSGSMVRRTLEMNAGAGAQLPGTPRESEKEQTKSTGSPEKTKAA
jgi:hypothetical protein